MLSVTLLTHTTLMIVELIEHSITGAWSGVGCALSDLIVPLALTLQGINRPMDFQVNQSSSVWDGIVNRGYKYCLRIQDFSDSIIRVFDPAPPRI